MTREEAIERLKTDIYKYADFTENPNENEFWMAFDMAIKALETEPCEDTISRQAVKDLYYKNGYIDFRKVCELPPVNTQPKTGHWIYEDVLYSRCSECGELAIIANWAKVLSDFCPCCGARMVEPQESEE